MPPISVVLARQRNRYIDGLTAFRHGDDAGWIEQFSAAAAAAATLANGYLDAVAALQQRWKDALAQAPNPRADAAAWAVIDQLPGLPVITGPVAAAATGRAKAAVYQALGQLEGAGVLKPLGSTRRNRSWEAEGLLDLQIALEAGHPAS